MKLGNILIFGDSYSTFKGCIPDGFACYYEGNNRPECHVDCADKTWWRLLMKETGATLLQNNSWSGSTIAYAGREGDASKTSSFIYRFRKLRDEGFFKENALDTVFVFGGTNDDWINTPLGDIKFSDFEENELFFVRPAIAHFLKSLRDELPNTRIVSIINTGFKPEITEIIEESCKKFNIITVKLHDIEKAEGHPTAAGMMQICNQVISKVEHSKQ